MKKIDAAVEWAIKTAMDDTHGYDQEKRQGPDYDCSSFICSALYGAGFSISPFSYTGNMLDRLLSLSFYKVTNTAPFKLKRGDIFLTPYHHTCMAIDATRVVHASINELGKVTGGKSGDQTGKEICIRNFYIPSYGWKYQLRYEKDEDFYESEPIDLVAREVIQGKWGNGEERKKRLSEAGFDYQSVQMKVNQLANNHGKYDYEIAREVIAGKWGVGYERYKRLTNAGYDYKSIQKCVNELMRIYE